MSLIYLIQAEHGENLESYKLECNYNISLNCFLIMFNEGFNVFV